jgi:hexokinase
MGDKTFHLRQKKYRVSEQLKTGEVTKLFDYLADSVDAFLSSPDSPVTAGIPVSLSPHPSAPSTPGIRTPAPLDVTHLGLTFSFPVDQTALDSGKLLTWTKGFSATGAIGKDIVKLLQDAFDRKHMHVKCVALVNDVSP